MEVQLITNENLKKNSTLIVLINACAYLLFFIFGYISILRSYYSGIFLNLYSVLSLNTKELIDLFYFMGLEMDIRSIYLFYFSILIICVINFITLIKYFVKKSNLEKYFIGNYSKFIFLPLILFTILNFFGYPKLKEKDIGEILIPISNRRLTYSLCICFYGLIILGCFYFLSFIKKNEEEANEESPNYSLKIFYEVLFIFYLYYFFYLNQLIKIKSKIKYINEYWHKIYYEEKQLPLKFQVTMAGIIETVFGLIGLIIIFLGKAFTYAFYQIFIYVAFLIMRADNGKINMKDDTIILSAYDYVISIIILIATLGCLCFLIIKKF